MSALDELQARKEVSDSARGRLRSILSAAAATPAVAAAPILAGPPLYSGQEEEVRRVASIQQSSRYASYASSITLSVSALDAFQAST